MKSMLAARAAFLAVWVFAALALVACGGDDESADASADVSTNDGSSDGSTEAGEPDATEPDATEPDATEPDATEPDATEPDATEPDASEPDATEPDASEPDATEPDSSEPDASEPDASEPDASDAAMDTMDAEPDTMEPPVDTAAACRLQARRLFMDGVAVGFPIEAERLASRGRIRAKVILVDFPDEPATRTPAEAFGLLSPGAEEFFEDVSYGALDLEVSSNMTWLRLSRNAQDYGDALLSTSGFRAFIQEAINLADPDVDFSDSDLIVVLANPDATQLPFGPTFVGLDGDGFRVDGRLITNAITSGHDLLFWGSTWLNHEMGHAMGLPDLYDGDEPTGYTRPFGLMDSINNEAAGHLGWERFQLGWLSSEQISCNVLDETIALSPLAIAGGGTKAAMMPVSPTRILVAESRRAIGYDDELREPGVLVTVVDMTVPNLMGPIRALNDQAALTVGESIVSDGIRIEFVSSDADTDSVRFTRE